MISINKSGGLFAGRMFGANSLMSSIPLSSLSSPEMKKRMKAAGIDVNSKQYKAVINEMKKGQNGKECYTNILAIRNMMRSYDKDGDYICPTNGLAGLLVTDENRDSRNRIIDIPESSKDEMFELTKKEFIREYGVANGDTTKRSDVYTNLYHKMPKKERLAAGHTLEQYERQYTQACVNAVKAANPGWRPGQPFDAGALDGITRESVDSTLVQSGSSLVRQSVEYGI